MAREVSYAKGAQLARQGEVSRGAFFIRRGRVEAQVALPGGGRLTVAELGEGDLFGEMALIERGVCTATVVAVEPVEGWFVGRDDFRAMLASREPGAFELQREITRVLAAKLRALNDKVRRHPAPEDRPAREPAPRAGAQRSAPTFDWRRFLPVLPFFEGFEAEEVEDVAAIGRAFELPRGAALFAEQEPAGACFVVVRGAVEVFTTMGRLERRVALAGPGELVGYLSVLERARHAAHARVREPACLLELPAASFLQLYESSSGTAIRLQRAVHRSLMRSIARTNTLLTRLIAHARLQASVAEAAELEAALHAQLWRAQDAATRTPT